MIKKRIAIPRLVFIVIILTFQLLNYSCHSSSKSISGDQIIENYITAIGGEDKLTKINSLYKVVKCESLDYYEEIYIKKPDKYLLKMIFTHDTIKQVLNKNTAVAISSYGVEPLLKATAQEIKNHIKIFPELYRKTEGVENIYMGVEKINCIDYYKVIVNFPEGYSQTEYYNIRTSLRYKTTDRYNVDTIIDSYLYIDGVKFVKSYIVKITNQKAIYNRITDIKVNPALDDNLFSIDL